MNSIAPFTPAARSAKPSMSMSSTLPHEVSGPAALRRFTKNSQGGPGSQPTWAPDGRATFSYAEPVKPGQPHVEWRLIGTHEIFKEP